MTVHQQAVGNKLSGSALHNQRLQARFNGPAQAPAPPLMTEQLLLPVEEKKNELFISLQSLVADHINRLIPCPANRQLLETIYGLIATSNNATVNNAIEGKKQILDAECDIIYHKIAYLRKKASYFDESYREHIQFLEAKYDKFYEKMNNHELDEAGNDDYCMALAFNDLALELSHMAHDVEKKELKAMIDNYAKEGIEFKLDERKMGSKLCQTPIDEGEYSVRLIELHEKNLQYRAEGKVRHLKHLVVLAEREKQQKIEEQRCHEDYLQYKAQEAREKVYEAKIEEAIRIKREKEAEEELLEKVKANLELEMEKRYRELDDKLKVERANLEKKISQGYELMQAKTYQACAHMSKAEIEKIWQNGYCVLQQKARELEADLADNHSKQYKELRNKILGPQSIEAEKQRLAALDTEENKAVEKEAAAKARKEAAALGKIEKEVDKLCEEYPDMSTRQIESHRKKITARIAREDREQDRKDAEEVAELTLLLAKDKELVENREKQELELKERLSNMTAEQRKLYDKEIDARDKLKEAQDHQKDMALIKKLQAMTAEERANYMSESTSEDE